MWPNGWVSVKLHFYITAALELGEWSAAKTRAALYPGSKRYPFYRIWVGRRAYLDGWKISSAPGPDHHSPARSQSLYHQRYQVHNNIKYYSKIQYINIPTYYCLGTLRHLIIKITIKICINTKFIRKDINFFYFNKLIPLCILTANYYITVHSAVRH